MDVAKVLWGAFLAFARASLRRLSRGPSSPRWSWRLEWIVAVQRAFLTATIDWAPARLRALTAARTGRHTRALERAEERPGGVLCERSWPRGSEPDRHLLYMHGGGFAYGSVGSHRELVSTIAYLGGLCAHSVDYRQPPEHRFPAAVDDVVSAYRGLLDSGIDARHVSIAGDSAGGNLCLALLVRVRAEGLPRPASAVLIAPAPDLALPGASWNAEPYLDYVTRPIAKAWLDHYVDPDQYTDPLASPIHADLRDLPPVLLHAGGHEGLLDEIETLAAALRKAEVPLTYTIAPEMPHVWHLFGGLIPEAEASLREIAEFVLATSAKGPGAAAS